MHLRNRIMEKTGLHVSVSLANVFWSTYVRDDVGPDILLFSKHPVFQNMAEASVVLTWKLTPAKKKATYLLLGGNPLIY